MKQDKKHLKRMVKRAEEIVLNVRFALLPMDTLQLIAHDQETFADLYDRREVVISHMFRATNSLFEMASEGTGVEITDEELKDMGKCAEEAAQEFVNYIVKIQEDCEERQVKNALRKARRDEKNFARIKAAVAEIEKEQEKYESERTEHKD